MNITMSPQQPMLSVTKAIPFQSGIFADVWRVTQERYYQVKKVGNDSNLLIVFYVQIMPDDFVMQLHRF